MHPLPFEQKVEATIKCHRMVQASDRLLVAVSGGADSVCLARVLAALGYRLALAHLNHALRGADSDADEQFVGQLAGELGVPLFSKQLAVGDLTGNLEAAGRQARRAFFSSIRKKEDFATVALAHSRNDCIETFFLNLLRGSGTQGLVSMSSRGPGLIRPLIETTREEIEAYLTDLGQTWRTDSSNSDLQFARNRVRHEVLPHLSESFNPNLVDTLARTVAITSAENQWMDEMAREWVHTHLISPDPGNPDLESQLPRLKIADLASHHVAFQRRVLRSALAETGSGLKDIGFERLESLRNLLGGGQSGKVIELPGRVQVERSFDALVFISAEIPSAAYEYELSIPGRIHIPELGFGFEAREIAPGPADGQAGEVGVLVDGESLGPYVKIRNWKNGDTYDPVGLPKSRLKTLFQAKRISRCMRRRWPVFFLESSIVWVASFPVSRAYLATERSARVIRIEALRSFR